MAALRKKFVTNGSGAPSLGIRGQVGVGDGLKYILLTLHYARLSRCRAQNQKIRAMREICHWTRRQVNQMKDLRLPDVGHQGDPPNHRNEIDTPRTTLWI